MRIHLPKIGDYPALLEACRHRHLNPREPNAPTVISLFAGRGGSSLGYSRAGYRELLTVEWDDHAVETFNQGRYVLKVFAAKLICLPNSVRLLAELLR